MKKLNRKGFVFSGLLTIIMTVASAMLLSLLNLDTQLSLGASSTDSSVLEDAKKGSFASTAMAVADAAEQIYQIDMLWGKSKSCYSVAELVAEGYLDNVDVYTSTGGTYDGYAQVIGGSWYVYLNNHNYEYVINGKNGVIDKDDVGLISEGESYVSSYCLE